MGLIASVMCTCFAQVITDNPPFAEHVKSDQSGFLILDLPYELNQDMHHQFDRWLRSACQHPRMDLASEVFNWTGYRSFQQVLAATESGHFPVLNAQLPRSGGGITDAAAAAKMLEELTSFIEQVDLGSTTVLVDTDTGQELHEHIAAYDGVFCIGADAIDMGVDERGFFIRRRQDGGSRELFRSMKFQQNLLHKGIRKMLRRGATEFVDLELGKKFRCDQAVFHVSPWPDGRMQDDVGKWHVDYPALLHVTQRQKEASEFNYIIKPLRKLCEAAVETGNPIRWH